MLKRSGRFSILSFVQREKYVLEDRDYFARRSRIGS